MKIGPALKKAIQFLAPNSDSSLSRPIHSGADLADAAAITPRPSGRLDSQDMVVAVVNFLARNVQSAQPRVSERTDDGLVPIADHPLLALLSDPNPDHTGVELMQATIGSLAVYGEAYWRKNRGQRSSQVVELYYTPYTLMRPVLSRDTALISHYEYRSGHGTRSSLPKEDVVHFRFSISDANQAMGLSPLRSLELELYTDQKAAEYTSEVLRNGMTTTLLSPEVSADGEMPTTDQLNAIRSLLSRLGRGNRRGEMEIIGGPVKSHKLGYSPREMNLRELRRVPEERVSARENLPAVVLGFGAGLDRSTFSNFAEAKEMAYEGNIVPTLDGMAATIQKYLLPDFTDEPQNFVVDFDLSKVRILQEDNTKREARLREQLAAGGITVAEYRTQLGYEANPGDEVYLRPLTIAEVPASGVRFVEPGTVPPVQQQRGTPEANAAPAPAAAADADAGAGADGNDEATAAAAIAGEIKEGIEDYQEAIVAAIKRDREQLVGQWQPQVLGMFNELGAIASVIAEDLLKSDDGAGEIKQPLTPEEELALTEIMQRLEASGAYQSWIDRSEVAWGQHYLRTASQTIETINTVLDLGVSLPDPASRRIIAEGGTRLGLVDIRGETRRAIFNALHDGRVAGEGPLQLSRRIREYVPAGRFRTAGPEYRSLMIARTETRYAQNFSSLQAYQSTSRVRAMLCFDAQAGPTDADCTDRNGREFTFDEAQTLSTSEHPNGTLDWAPIYGIRQ